MELSLRYKTVCEADSREKTNQLINWLRDYFSQRVNSRWIDERRCIPPYIVMDFARQGIFGFHVEKEFHGLSLKAVDWLRLIAQLGALDTTISQLVAINGLATRPLVAYASDNLKQRWLKPLAKGEILASYAQTEDSAGTAFLSMKSTAVFDENKDCWILNGSKTWIGNAGWSTVMIVIANTLSADGQDQGLTAFAVSTDIAGVSIGKELNTMGLRGVVQNQVCFNDVEIKREWAIGEPGNGMTVAVDAMSLTRLLIAAQQLGLMKKSVQQMWKFASKRTISTGLLIENAVALNYLSECIVRIDSVENLIQRCAAKLDRGETVDPALSSICKILTTEFAAFVSDKALQLLGGRGYEENNIIPQLIRDTRVTRIFEGPTEALLAFVGSRISGESGANLLRSIAPSSEIIEQIIDEVEEQQREIKAMSVEFSLSYEQRQQWIDFQSGLLASWAVLSAAYAFCPQHHKVIKEWLETGYAETPRFVAGACFLGIDDIKDALRRYENEVGDVPQSLPSLNWSLDELLS